MFCSVCTGPGAHCPTRAQLQPHCPQSMAHPVHSACRSGAAPRSHMDTCPDALPATARLHHVHHLQWPAYI